MFVYFQCLLFFIFIYCFQFSYLLFSTGYREEQERRPCTPPDESEEWDYEEGHSPVTQIKDPPVVSRYGVHDCYEVLLCTGFQRETRTYFVYGFINWVISFIFLMRPKLLESINSKCIGKLVWKREQFSFSISSR